MGQIKIHPPVKLFAAVTISDKSLWPVIKNKLEQLFSSIDRSIDWYSFHHTQYYQAEMGQNLIKRMISFAELIWAEKLMDIKLTTNKIEEEFSNDRKRKVNIDPGYLCASKIVLATTKDFSHRIYLGRGIFGDLHLQYRNNRFQPTDWTYPDYREPFVLKFFEQVRET
ncbi:MAG: DUF4416 family protein [bacterium]